MDLLIRATNLLRIRHGAFIILGVLVVGSVLAACGDSRPPEAMSVSTKALDRRIPDLPPGASLAAVEARLGEPASKIEVGNETVLSYGLWRLVVEDGRLTQRIRDRGTIQTGVVVPSDRESGELDEKILTLSLGMSLENVRKRLGPPEHNEEVFEGTDKPIVALMYGPWELRFRDGELEERTKF
jgi:hypothetical protein